MNNQESEDRSFAPATLFPGFAPTRAPEREREHWERGRRAKVKPLLLTPQGFNYAGKLLYELRRTVNAVSI